MVDKWLDDLLNEFENGIISKEQFKKEVIKLKIIGFRKAEARYKVRIIKAISLLTDRGLVESKSFFDNIIAQPKDCSIGFDNTLRSKK